MANHLSTLHLVLRSWQWVTSPAHHLVYVHFAAQQLEGVWNAWKACWSGNVKLKRKVWMIWKNLLIAERLAAAFTVAGISSIGSSAFELCELYGTKHIQIQAALLGVLEWLVMQQAGWPQEVRPCLRPFWLK